VVRIYPEGPEVDLGLLRERIREALPPGMLLGRTEEEPLAFGISILKAYIVTGDEEGVTEAIENSLSAVEGVSEVFVESSGRI